MKRLSRYLLPLSASLVVVALLFFSPDRPSFIITTSPSMPPGLYHIDYTASPKRGDIVVFRLPKEVEQVMTSHSWFQPGIRYLKKVGATAGDTICTSEAELRINEDHTLPLFSKDREGYPLPHLIKGCLALHENQFLPISEHFVRSFDGRYYGALELKNIEGVAELVIRF